MVDVEFDSTDDVPEILNALKIKVMVEKFNAKNDKIRTASLLPTQVRFGFARALSWARAPPPRAHPCTPAL